MSPIAGRTEMPRSTTIRADSRPGDFAFSSRTVIRGHVNELLERYAAAFAARSAVAIASCFQPPILIVTEHGAIALSSRSAIADEYMPVIDQFHSQGLVAMRHHLRGMSKVTSSLCEITVNWTYQGKSEGDRFTDRYRYLLRRTDTRTLRFQMVTALGGPTETLEHPHPIDTRDSRQLRYRHSKDGSFP